MIGAFRTALSQDIFRRPLNIACVDTHLREAVGWLKRAHDATGDGGVSYGFYLRGRPFSQYGPGWRPSYVETSGYIIETFYDIAIAHDDNDIAIRAENIGYWLTQVQKCDGSFSNESTGDKASIIFDTGQVLFGLLRCYAETKDQVFRRSAQKAAYWLVSKQSEDGAWRNNTHRNIIHTYNTRVAWAMLEYCKLFPDQDIYEAASKNLLWALTQQSESGLFQNCGFSKDETPFTHTIAYAIRGLYEGGLSLNDPDMLSAAQRAAKAVAQQVNPETGFLPGRISDIKNPNISFSCLTGNCQMAIIWYKMSAYFGDSSLASLANNVMDYVLNVHDINTPNDNIRGAVKGSHPIWGQYTPLAYPNWATKFFIDAVLMKESTTKPC